MKFSNTSTGSISSYSWSFRDGARGTLAAPSHTYAAAGVYTVSLTVKGPGGNNTQTRTNYVTVAARATTALPVAQFTDTAPPFLDTGLYRKLVPGTGTAYYRFMLDYNFDHVSNVTIPFGTAGDVPLVGYMSPGGKSSLII